MKLSIVIPAHNEEQRLPPVLRSYAALFEEELGAEVEILLVANGCSDQTASVALAIAEECSSIKVIDEPRRIGKGGAVILGVKAACGDYVGFVDADGATSAEEFLRLYKKAQGNDGIIASRWAKGSDVTIPQKAMRLLSSRIFNGLTRLLLGLKFRDTQCGAKIFKAEAWRNILPNIGITRFAFDVDVLFQLKRHGYAVHEEPTVWKDIEGTKVSFFSSSADMFLAVIRMRLIYSPFSFLVRIYEKVFSKLVEYLRRDELFCHAMLLFMASMVTHVCNIGYQMVVSRALPKTEFALLTTFLALFAVLARPLITLTTAIIHYTSLLCKEHREGAVQRLVIKWCLIAGGPSLLLSVICVMRADSIASFFHLERVEPVIVSALALPAMFVTPVVGGALRGLQRFGWISFSSSIGAVVRLLLGAAFVFLLFPACGWALVGHVGGMYISLLVTAIILFFVLKGFEIDTGALPSLRFYLAQCFIIQISSAVLMTGDVVLVKHYLPEETDFAYAATLGRMVLFLVVAVVAAMFPKVSSSSGFSKKQRNIYYKSLMYTAVVMLASVACCFLFPEILHRVLFKITEPTAHLIRLTRWMAVVMAMVTLMNINITLLLAQRRFLLAGISVPAAIMYLFSVHLYHSSAYNILVFAGISAGLTFAVTFVGIVRAKLVPEGRSGEFIR